MEPVSGLLERLRRPMGPVVPPDPTDCFDRARIVDTAIEIADRNGLGGGDDADRRTHPRDGPDVALPPRPGQERPGLDDGRRGDRGRRPGFASRWSSPVAGSTMGWWLVAASTWRLCGAHPWYPEASMVRPLLTPSALAGFERALSIFDGFDLDIGTKAQFVGTVHSTVIFGRPSTPRSKRRRAAGRGFRPRRGVYRRGSDRRTGDRERRVPAGLGVHHRRGASRRGGTDVGGGRADPRRRRSPDR